MYANTLQFNLYTSSSSSCDVGYSSSCICISAPECANIDGSISNKAVCLCGSTGCTATTGYFCYASSNFCAPGPPCSITDGSAVSSGPGCKCGNAICNQLTGLICYANFGGGSCRKNNVGDFGYPKSKYYPCRSVSGRQAILDRSSCEAAAVDLALSDVVAEEHSSSSSSPGCYWTGDTLKFNKKMTSSAYCSSSDYCLCIASRDCVNKDGREGKFSFFVQNVFLSF